MIKPTIAITDIDRGAVGKILDTLLSDEYVLYTKTRNYHWNVTGTGFDLLHKFFEGQFEELDRTVDAVAERARALGLFSMGTLYEFRKHTRLEERPGRLPNSEGMLVELLGDHEELVRALRLDAPICAKHHDMGTSDFLTGLMGQHEQMAWKLRSSLERRKGH